MAVKSVPKTATLFACSLLLLLSVATIVMQIMVLLEPPNDILNKMSAGIWSGAFGLVTSACGFFSNSRPTRGRLVFFLVFSLTTFLVDIAALIVLILVTAFDGDDSGSKTISILNIVMISSLGIELFCLLMTILISSQAFCCGKDVTGSNLALFSGTQTETKATLQLTPSRRKSVQEPKSILKATPSTGGADNQVMQESPAPKPVLSRRDSPAPGEYRAYLKGAEVTRSESNVSSSSSRQVGRNPSIYKKSPIDMDEILNHPIQRHQKPHLKNQGGQSRNLANSIDVLDSVIDEAISELEDHVD